MRTYAVEVICNREKEPERLQTLQTVLDYFKVEPVCTVWGEEARGHELFSKFRSITNINAISLAINHIELFKKYNGTDIYLLIFESDVIPIYDMAYIDNEIHGTIEEMKEKSIDFCFIGEGCFGKVTPPDFPVPMQKSTDTLYTGYYSRCTESYIVSPRGIEMFLQFMDTFDNTAIDYTFNCFFEQTKTLSAWRIPELFVQGSQLNLYKGNIQVTII